ncbi:hypothetical protein BDN70DRAFT_898809 [Pholiota conissans]|uniref:Uncharacterized protein n=1 Tax=Pholiota conissans TaxID=109636 RepID=A0A9P6CPG5_9AGAR|nr:hypothetical protein BDN70DRAFT_898809 [Pholiota conissans]
MQRWRRWLWEVWISGGLVVVQMTHLEALPLPGSALGILLPCSVVARERACIPKVSELSRSNAVASREGRGECQPDRGYGLDRSTQFAVHVGSGPVFFRSFSGLVTGPPNTNLKWYLL